ncbi:MAG: sigma 54-interacting transcriptional regulator [Lachnospiraceae bacterium]|nr:sigma 54-interacting transcriptional regulator [Lachnospiraceae bacterium]
MDKKETFKKWEDLHNGNYLENLPTEIAAAWKNCKERNLDPYNPTYISCDATMFEEIKRNSTRIFAYSNRFIITQQKFIKNKNLGILLFDENGWLLKLYGNNDFMKWAREENLTPMTNWNMENMGASAVSLGLSLGKHFEFLPYQNYSVAQTGFSTYFSPFALNSDKGPTKGKNQVLGGIAIVVPLEFSNENDDYLITTAAIANDICIHMHMSNNLEKLYQDEPLGFITIDVDLRTGKPHILYHNKNIFKVFEIPFEDLYFKPAENLFDPLPQNKRLWEIVEDSLEVKNEIMELSIKGVKASYIITSSSYYQPNLTIRGIHFYVDSRKQVTSYVSKKVGNNARLTFDDILGNDPNFVNAINHAKTLALSDSNVLILGESGSGKDIFAQAIHNASKRRKLPFVPVNCAAFPRDLIASELFGYDSGAFTGSKKGGYIGKFELANTGTVFLDEIGDMPLDLQAILLRVIETKSFMRLGSNTQINIDVKIIAATNANLMQKIEQKKFREDLYYRLSTLRLFIPPLKDRSSDIILLAGHFIDSVSKRVQRTPPILSEDAKALIMSLPWKGNVRELQNLIEGIVQLYPENIITCSHIREYLGVSSDSYRNYTHIEERASEDLGFKRMPHSRDELLNALKLNKYNKTNTAMYLGVSRKTLYRWIDEMNLKP